jgi:hypothetical protein
MLAPRWAMALAALTSCSRPTGDRPPVPDAAPSAAASCEGALRRARLALSIELGPLPGALPRLERGLTIAARSCARGGWPLPLRRCVADVPLLGADSGSAGLWRCLPLVPAALRRELEPELRQL